MPALLCIITRCEINYPEVSHVRGRVVIDPGHGGEDSGAIGKGGLLEKDVTLDIGKRVGRLFKQFMPKIDVVFTRTSDRYVSLDDRVQLPIGGQVMSLCLFI